MHIALHRNHDLGPGEAVLHVRGAGRLLLIPFAIVGGHGVNIMGDRVAVFQLQRLAGANADHARQKHAAMLIDHHAFLGRLELLVFQARLDVDERVGEPAFGPIRTESS